MSSLRVIVTVLLLLAWLPATNACFLASAFPDQMAECCSSEQGGVVKGIDGNNGCETCVLPENGSQESAHFTFVLSEPFFSEIEHLSRLLWTFAAETALEQPQRSAEPQQALWHFVLRTALPVRGPSFPA